MSRTDSPFATEMSLPLREKILQQQIECTFIWGTQSGNGLGTMMSFLWDNERVWLSTNKNNLRVRALQRNPHACIVISSAGLNLGASQSITIHGQVSLHACSSLDPKVIEKFCAKLFPDSEKAQRNMQALLQGPQQIWFEFIPEKWSCYDGDTLIQQLRNS